MCRLELQKIIIKGKQRSHKKGCHNFNELSPFLSF